MDQALAQLVRERAHGLCEYCRMPELYDRPQFQIEHIIACQHGGPLDARNLAWACFSCNKIKGPNLSGIDSVTGTVVPLFQPRRHKWSRHFPWHPAPVQRMALGFLRLTGRAFFARIVGKGTRNERKMRNGNSLKSHLRFSGRDLIFREWN
jgi:hypothetical protein